MKKNLAVLFLMAACSVVILPTQGAAYATGDNKIAVAGLNTENLVLQQRRGRGSRNWRSWDNRGRRRSGSWYGYRNYGQYRRTQVGNRRYRYVRRPYYRDGRRYYRLTRIFY